MALKLNRKSRRSQKTWRRPSPTDTPAQQMQAFLQAPGKFHIVMLPDEKSFVVKVTEEEMPIFLVICQQLKGVLGHCEAIPATPVEASVADTNMIAQQTADATKRIRMARRRQEAAEQRIDDKIDAAIARHPAGKKRPAGGRHRAEGPETAFDRLAATVPDDEEGQKRVAAIEIAAAQDAVATKQAELEEANNRLRDAYDRGGELHNRSVLEKMTDRATEAIAEITEEPGLYPHWKVDGPGSFEVPPEDQDDPAIHTYGCPLCPAEFEGPSKTEIVQMYNAHIQSAHKPPTDAAT